MYWGLDHRKNSFFLFKFTSCSYFVAMNKSFGNISAFNFCDFCTIQLSVFVTSFVEAEGERKLEAGGLWTGSRQRMLNGNHSCKCQTFNEILTNWEIQGEMLEDEDACFVDNNSRKLPSFIPEIVSGNASNDNFTR